MEAVRDYKNKSILLKLFLDGKAAYSSVNLQNFSSSSDSDSYNIVFNYFQHNDDLATIY